MTDPIVGHFEWQDANPLLADIPGDMTDAEMAALLAYDPADAWSGQIVPERSRNSAADSVIQVFVPVSRCVKAIQRIHRGLLKGLRARDPRLPQNRKAIYERAALATQINRGKIGITKLPWFNSGASGYVFSGSTGEGKSMLIERYISNIPQVLVRPANESCGWLDLKQLVYLKVSMPANGGRLGLLTEIATEMDKVLGTDYHRELRARGTTIDVQLVMVLNWLAIHRCGLLIVEEAQERTAKTENFGADFLTYFLKILNWGVPMLLIGNPKALAILETYVQDERRFSEAWVDFLPISDPDHPEWRDLVNSIWAWRVTGEPDRPIKNLPRFLWDLTAGHRAALSVLRREAILAALEEGASCIHKCHIKAGYDGIGYEKRRNYIEGLIKQDVGALGVYKDAPTAKLTALWQQESEAKGDFEAGAETKGETAIAESEEVLSTEDAKPTAAPKKRAPRAPKCLAPAIPPLSAGPKYDVDKADPGHPTHDVAGTGCVDATPKDAASPTAVGASDALDSAQVLHAIALAGPGSNRGSGTPAPEKKDDAASGRPPSYKGLFSPKKGKLPRSA